MLRIILFYLFICITIFSYELELKGYYVSSENHREKGTASFEEKNLLSGNIVDGRYNSSASFSSAEMLERYEVNFIKPFSEKIELGFGTMINFNYSKQDIDDSGMKYLLKTIPIYFLANFRFFESESKKFNISYLLKLGSNFTYSNKYKSTKLKYGGIGPFFSTGFDFRYSKVIVGVNIYKNWTYLEYKEQFITGDYEKICKDDYYVNELGGGISIGTRFDWKRD